MASDLMIEDIKSRLRDLALGDISRASQGGAKMGAFILGSCLIDYLAGYRFGKASTKASDYRRFVREYMNPLYNPNNLYSDLRCKLVHNYSEGGSYIFTDNNTSRHFQRLSSGKLVINLEDFIADLTKAMEAYFSELDQHLFLQQNAKNRHRAIGLLKVFSTTKNL